MYDTDCKTNVCWFLPRKRMRLAGKVDLSFAHHCALLSGQSPIGDDVQRPEHVVAMNACLGGVFGT
jgi:hypothetical protein